MVSRKDYRELALIWVDIMDNFDEFVHAVVIHEFFKEQMNKVFTNFDIDKYDKFVFKHLS